MPFRRFGSLLLLVVVAAIPRWAWCAQGDDYVVVVSPDVPVSTLSLEEVRRLYLFEKRYWSTGHAVTLLFSEETLTPDSFLLERVYRMNYPSVRRLILEKLYQGEIDLAPKIVATDDAAVAFVASGRGLVALVHRESIKGSAVKVIPLEKEPLASDPSASER